MNENDVKIAAIQETKLRETSKVGDTFNFILKRKDRGRNAGGGLAFLIHQSIPFQMLPSQNNDPHIEHMAIKVDDVIISNMYIPPQSSCNTENYSASLSPYLTNDDNILLGDFNAHDELWYSALQDARGTNLAAEIGASGYATLNDDSPTRLFNGTESSPDFSLASLSLLPYASWETKKQLGSDHLPIIVSLKTDLSPSTSDDRTFINFRRADWTGFREKTEAEFSNLPRPTNVFKGEKSFRKIINKISKVAIPHGRIKDVYPEIPTEAADLIKERDQLRLNDPHAQELSDMNKEIDAKIQQHRKDKWRAYVEDVDRKKDPSQLFKLIKFLNGDKNNKTSNEAIKFKGKFISHPKKMANAFNKQYSSTIQHRSSKTARKIKKNIRKNKLDADEQEFSDQQTTDAIKKARPSKALGPDKISTLHLKHLGPLGVRYLTDLFNISAKTSQIPAIWKTSTIIPLLKPNKPADTSTSYRPVSLLCPSIKIFERLLLPTLTQHLPVPDIQHGFRKNHSTVSALSDFAIDIANGFNQPKPADRTLLLQVDLSKAFDMVSHEKLLHDLNETSLPDFVKRWLSCYLSGRQSKVSFRNTTSSGRIVRTGVPQGAVSSPLLFNFYLSNLPTPPANVKIVQYADDISVYVTGKDVPSMCTLINDYASLLIDFLAERNLVVSPEKSTVTLFSPDNRQINLHPEVYIDGCQVKTEKNPKLLGVVFDPLFTFNEHVRLTIKKAKAKINVLKALAGSTWGQDQETLLITYKSICRSVLEYGCPVWAPVISETSWTNLQRVQNQALRVATGSLLMAGIDHLHQETKVLPIKQHSQLLTDQYLANTYLPAHPGYKNLDLETPPRKMKATMLDSKTRISDLFTAGRNKKQVQQSLHTECVRYCLSTYEVNRVLLAQPPEVAPDEADLRREVRVELSRLRSGFSRNLQNYLHRLDETVPDRCPLCNQTPHDTAHLFNCQANPTELEPIDLWTRPKLAAIFLKLDESDVEE